MTNSGIIGINGNFLNLGETNTETYDETVKRIKADGYIKRAEYPDYESSSVIFNNKLNSYKNNNFDVVVLLAYRPEYMGGKGGNAKEIWAKPLSPTAENYYNTVNNELIPKGFQKCILSVNEYKAEGDEIRTIVNGFGVTESWFKRPDYNPPPPTKKEIFIHKLNCFFYKLTHLFR